jgi:hypothetical protein
MKPKMTKAMMMALFIGVSAIATVACSPEVGSEEWCSDLKEKSKGDWTASEAGDFAKNCVL